MDHTAANATPLRPAVFRDGFGERRRMADTAGIDKLEVLCFRRDLGALETFEAAVRESAAQLAQFRHRAFARVRTVERLNDQAATLVVAAEPTAGTRLSELLNIADQHGIALDGSAEWCLIRQLVAAVSNLHQQGPQAMHGAIAPERLIVTPEGDLIVVEHVLGKALPTLRFSAERYWRDFRVACLASTTDLNQRTDVTQIGLVALSLVLGRPLGNHEYPARIAELVESAWAKASVIDVEPTAPPLRAWLAKALQLDQRHSFASAVDAEAALETALSESGYTLTSGDVRTFLIRCQSTQEPQAVAQSTSKATPAPEPAAPKTPAPEASAPKQSVEKAAPEPVAPTPTATPTPVPAAAHKTTLLSVTRTDQPAPSEESEPNVAATYFKRAVSLASANRRAAAAVIAVILLGGAGWAAASLFPLSELRAEPGETAAPAAIAANATVPAPDPAPLAVPPPPLPSPLFGQLDVRTEPAGATIMIDGVRRGVTPMTITDVSPGRHTVVVDNNFASATRTVMVEAGVTSSVTGQLAVAPVAPPTGTLQVAAPADLQLFEAGRLLGNSQGGRLTLPAGSHQIEFVNEPLGYRSTRTVNVAAGGGASVNIEFPKGTLALNAVPWAEVWVDGERVGETPIGNLPVTLGSHEVVFRNPDLGERRMVTTVTLTAPTRLSVDLRKQ